MEPVNNIPAEQYPRYGKIGDLASTIFGGIERSFQPGDKIDVRPIVDEDKHAAFNEFLNERRPDSVDKMPVQKDADVQFKFVKETCALTKEGGEAFCADGYLDYSEVAEGLKKFGLAEENPFYKIEVAEKGWRLRGLAEMHQCAAAGCLPPQEEKSTDGSAAAGGGTVFVAHHYRPTWIAGTLALLTAGIITVSAGWSRRFFWGGTGMQLVRGAVWFLPRLAAGFGLAGGVFGLLMLADFVAKRFNDRGLLLPAGENLLGPVVKKLPFLGSVYSLIAGFLPNSDPQKKEGAK